MYAEETHAITEDHQGVAANGEPSKHVDVHDEDTMSARNTGHPQEVEYDHLAIFVEDDEHNQGGHWEVGDPKDVKFEHSKRKLVWNSQSPSLFVAFQMQEKELPLEHKLGHDHSSKSTQLGTSEVSLSPERLGLAHQNKHIWDSCQLCAWQEARSSSQQSGRAHPTPQPNQLLGQSHSKEPRKMVLPKLSVANEGQQRKVQKPERASDVCTILSLHIGLHKMRRGW